MWEIDELSDMKWKQYVADSMALMVGQNDVSLERIHSKDFNGVKDYFSKYSWFLRGYNVYNYMQSTKLNRLMA